MLENQNLKEVVKKISEIELVIKEIVAKKLFQNSNDFAQVKFQAKTLSQMVDSYQQSVDGHKKTASQLSDEQKVLVQKLKDLDDRVSYLKISHGIDGKNAYDIWIANGNTGSETDFLNSLKGKDGASGANGKDGKNGTDIDADTVINKINSAPTKKVSISKVENLQTILTALDTQSSQTNQNLSALQSKVNTGNPSTLRVTKNGISIKEAVTSINILTGTVTPNGNGVDISLSNSSTAWVTAKAYLIGDIVTNENRTYTANTAHTSGTFNTDRANWTVSVSLPLATWQASIYYYAGETAYTTSGDLITRTTSGTSNATFNLLEGGNWSITNSNQNIPTWTANTYYFANKILTDGNVYFKRIASGFSGATLNAFELGNYTYISQTKINLWTAITAYLAGTQAYSPIPQQSLIQLIATGTSNATFTTAESNLWNYISPNRRYTLVTPAEYNVGDEILNPINTSVIMRCITQHVSATWTLAEAGNWTVISTGIPGTWSASTVYVTGQQIIKFGQLLEANTTFTSGATFVTSEYANWTILGEVTANTYFLPTTSGTGTAYTVTATDKVSTFINGDTFYVRFNVVSGIAPTLNITNQLTTALGAKSLVTPGGVALVANQLTTGTLYQIVYDGTNLIVTSFPNDLPSVVKTASYTATVNEELIEVDTTALAVTITLPAGTANSNKLYKVAWIAGANACNVTSATQLVDVDGTLKSTVTLSGIRNCYNWNRGSANYLLN